MPFIPDYDARWKDIIERFPDWFLLKFFPVLHRERDTSFKIRFLDKEFQKLLADWRSKGKIIGDKLMELRLKTGKRKMVLVHAEVEKKFDPSIMERVFKSFVRLMEKYPDHDITILVIYIGSKVPSKFKVFTYEFQGLKLRFEVNAYIVREQDSAALEASDNPIDLALLSALYTLKRKQGTWTDSDFVNKFGRLCLQRGYNKEDIEFLLNFVLFLLYMPPAVKEETEKELINLLDMNVSQQEIEQMPVTGRALLKLVKLWANSDMDNEKFTKLFEGILDVSTIGKKEKSRKALLNEAKQEVRQEVKQEVRQEVKQEVRQEVKQEVLQGHILNMHRKGFATDVIADVLESEISFVEETIKKAAQPARKKKSKP